MINLPEKPAEKQKSVVHPALQFLIFVAIFIGVILIGSAIGLGLVSALYGFKTFGAIAQSNTAYPHFVSALWIFQVLGTTLPILIAPLIFAYCVVSNPKEYIRSNFKFPWQLLILAFAIMLVSSPLIEFLSNINQKMVLPPFLHWMRESEDNAQKLTAALLHMDNVWEMLFDLLFVGLLTAIVEEFMFRGVLQTIFEKWTRNKHVAIWVTAILFSAFHMEFFGFLPRMLLGVLFGYFVAYSGSIWPAVWGHFINNGTAVVVTYLYQNKKTSLNPDDQHLFNYAGYAISFVIVLFLFWLYRNIGTGKKPALA